MRAPLRDDRAGEPANRRSGECQDDRIGGASDRRIGEGNFIRHFQNPHSSEDAGSPTRRLAGSSMTVLGIDPGLATTGWGVVEKTSKQLTLKAYGAICSEAGTDLPTRLNQIRIDLAHLIATYRPQMMAIEELFFTKFAISIAATAQARGVILVTAAECGLPVIEYNPRAVKIAMTGFGSASKIQMQSMLQRHFRLAELPKPDDAADAVAIALCHVQTHGSLKARTDRRTRAAFEAEMAARAASRPV